ncbi:DTW domain-containing protein [Shewanella marina]|uniref:DTW domain-containing protein n=1 Tax=Shewanella marina TaxID=487319 RepID=UPI00046EC74A|nr:tRNA-uridine aminocarboxypropyltransferase [Shewanella marina]
MQIILLTHERECDRPTNTGQLALKLFPDICRKLVWSRTKPDVELVKAFAEQKAWLLFPETTEQITPHRLLDDDAVELPEVVVLLDATWQEARKMYRQSAYLKQANTCSFNQITPSSYSKRRNQIEGGLCSAECIELLLRLDHRESQAQQLASAFLALNNS